MKSKKAILLSICFEVVLMLHLAFIFFSGGFTNPPEVGDGQDYDAIAYNLAAGRGYGYFWSDAGWRRPFIEHNSRGEYDIILTRQGEFQKTAYRPPALPILLAGIYALFGRQFVILRLLNALLYSTMVVVVIGLVWDVSGLFGAVPALLLAIVDQQAYTFSSGYMTECLASFVVCLLFLKLVKPNDRTGLREAWVVGGLCGLVVLVRSVFIAFIPFILIWVLLASVNSPAKKRLGEAARFAAVILAGSLLVLMPWFVRNCLVLGKVMPLGTQGSIGFLDGYNDLILNQTRGAWLPYTPPGVSRVLDVTSIQGEAQLAEIRSTRAIEWIKSHLAQLPKLAVLKAAFLWTPTTTYSNLLLVFGAMGLFAQRRSRIGFASGWLLLAITMAVAVTWSDGERFLFPLRPIFYVLGGLGMAAVIQWALRIAKPLMRV